MIKTSFRLIFAALAATVVLASSCTKEIPAGQDSDPKASQSEGSRVIAVSFASSTKTALGEDGLTPEFTGQNEWVKVSNLSMSEDCKVVVSSSGRTTITTSLEGKLTAVYPASAAKMQENRITGVSVSAWQDGTFASANICMAEMTNEEEESLTFHNKTALFVITPPEGTVQLTAKSLAQIEESSGQRTGYASPITTNNGNAAFTVTATGKAADGKIYVSLTQGVKLSDLSFEAEFATAGTGSIKGIPMKAIEEAKIENTTADGTIYTINGNNWHEYVTVNGVKWATMNIGAESETDAGLYFSWGETNGQTPSGTTFSPSFDWANYKYSNSDGTKFTKYTADKNDSSQSGQADGKTVIDLADDAAYVNWGGAWHIPTTKDTQELYDATTKELISESGVTGWKFTDKNYASSSLFIRIAGYGNNGSIVDPSINGYYWTSNLNSSEPNCACYLHLLKYMVDPQDRLGTRNSGFSVRAVVNESQIKNSFSGEVTVNSSGKKVNFTSGNLYWDGAALHIEDEQWKTLPTGNIARDESHVSQFYFCNTVENATSFNYTANDYYSDNDYFFCDEDHKITVDGLSGLYTLSYEEWDYLMCYRTKEAGTASCIGEAEDACFMMCNLQCDENSIFGTLIFPDVFTWPSGIPVPENSKINAVLEGKYLHTYSSADLAALESAGVVFLPAAGLRDKDESPIYGYNVLANYWSSTPNYWVPTLLFNYEDGWFDSGNNNNRHSASPIRLVKNEQ